MKDRRRTILEAAARVIARRGVRGLRVEELAAEAGVSKALVYYHFEDRAGLLRSTLEFIGARAERYTHRDPPAPQGPGAAVRDPGPSAHGPGPVVRGAGSAAHAPGAGPARREAGSAPDGHGPAPHGPGPAPRDPCSAPHGTGSALGELERRLLLELQDVPEIRENSTAWGELRAGAVFDPELREDLARVGVAWVREVADLLGQGSPAVPDIELVAAAERLTALLEGLSTRWLVGILPVGHARELMREAIAAEARRLDLPDRHIVCAAG
ncbi:TetR/AcrR family transcriptional regulator [Streptomyces zaomyceticus]|uniref:TetR/AcrR family transcriptional regulator n=1 Tax=Streptomyces zaomyceticus TaxID=68286 RepID=UPI0036863B62